MNKLKSMFKKDKDSKSESTPSYQSSGGTPSGSMSTGGAAAAYSGGSSSGGAPTGAQSATGMSSVAAVPQQSSGASYGGGGVMPQQSSGMSSGGAPAQQAPTESAFPPNNAPSTGVENADHPQGVVMHTTLGDITIALFAEQTPRTCKNFATLAATGKYDHVIFHRIIPGFMIQGGDPEGSGRGGRSIYGAKFEDEFHPDLKHTGKGIMSMANSGPNTNGSQFFICLAATPHLDMKHTVFGQVADGMDVVDRLGAVRTGAQDRPVQEVKILRCDVF